jgi:hypothetical protein
MAELSGFFSMDRKFANIPGWKRILKNRFYCTHLDTLEFGGCITLYCVVAIQAPMVVEYFHRPTCIVDAGYAWLKQFPAGGHCKIQARRLSRGILIFACCPPKR